MRVLCVIILLILAYPRFTVSADSNLGYFKRYEAENELVKAMDNHGTRVVFMGNSITDSWAKNHPEFFI